MFNFIVNVNDNFIIFPILVIYIISQFIIIFIILKRIINNKMQGLSRRFYLYGLGPFIFLSNILFIIESFLFGGRLPNWCGKIGKVWLIISLIVSAFFIISKLWRGLVRLIAKIFSRNEKASQEQKLLYLDDKYFRGKIIKQLNKWGKNNNRLQIEEVRVSLRELNQPLKILQITDLHIGAYFHPDEAYEVMKIANDQGCDLIFLTGDFINLDRRLAGISIDILSQLKAPMGVYACLGNHENFTETEDFFDKGLKANNISLLRNRYEKLSIRGEVFYILGVDYYKSAEAYKEICRIFRKIPADKTLLLCHHPNYFPLFAFYNIAMMFSGHTHGGQIKFEIGPAVIAPSLLLSPYLHGHYRINQSHLYVSRGIGTSGAPIRILCPPELTVFNLNL